MKKTTVILRNIILSLIFAAALYGTVRYLGYVVYPKVNGGELHSEDYFSYYFSKAERNSADTVFIGSSHLYCSVDVNILNRDYGMNSIMLSSSGQNLTLSYYAVMEAIELQHPETIVFEAYFTSFDSPPQLLPYTKHSFYDAMPNWTRAKYEAVKELGEPWYYYYFPLTALHERLTEVELSDFILPPSLPDGEQFYFTIDRTEAISPIILPAPDVKEPLGSNVEAQLDRIIRLCCDNDINLILYVAPYTASETDLARFNTVSDIAERNGLPYYNLFTELDEMGIDYNTDFLDNLHLNPAGQEKLTRYCAQKGYFTA